ncbi:hypothetical protein BBJ28_00016514 [Nothophytophthora sp. Chile5]|nr:hypothetical protein BBJ28_00016514 [Nothophytophthora sp. Chile5]
MEPARTLQPPKAKSKKTLKVFKADHEHQYGLKVSQRHPQTSAVLSCVCRFCAVFGRETRETNDDETRKNKRRKTSKIHYYSIFRTDLYRQHLGLVHPQKWTAFQLLTSNEKREELFACDVPYQEKLISHFDSSSTKLTIRVGAAIVDNLIGDLLFHPDEADSVTHKRALSLFTPTDGGGYEVVIKTPKRFSLLVGTVALGSSFRMAVRIVQLVRDETEMSVYSGCTDALASNYIRVVCATSLDQLSLLLRQSTGFSLALDSSTLHSHSYLDIRVRFYASGDMHNYHLLALPLFGAHTGKLMFDALVKLMNAVCPSWRDVLVGVATDGEPKMTGRVRGLASLIEADTTHKKVIRVNIIVIQEYYSKKTSPHTSAPDAAWWIFLFAVNSLTQEANTVFIKLQGLATLLSQQRASFVKLLDTFLVLTGMEGPLTSEQLGQIDVNERQNAESCDGFIMRHSSAKAYLIELDPWIESGLDNLQSEAKITVVSAVAKMFVMAASGVNSIVAERNSDNTVAEEVPPVLPHQLVHINMPAFNSQFELHHDRLLLHLDPVAVHQIGQEFVRLRRMYRTDELARANLDKATDTRTSFAEGWIDLGPQLPRLQQYCGDLASAFPNTTTVQSDFSVLGWEKDEYRRSLTDFSLEGILHAKQYHKLQRLGRIVRSDDTLGASG